MANGTNVKINLLNTDQLSKIKISYKLAKKGDFGFFSEPIILLKEEAGRRRKRKKIHIGSRIYNFTI